MNNMNSRHYTLLSFIFLFNFSFAQPKIKLDTFIRTVPTPVDITNDGFTSRLFIADQTGRVFVYDSTGTKLDTFIDLRTKVQYSANGEQGLLGLAFHPNYQNNGYFYVYYTKKNTTDNAVYRYKLSGNPNRANKDSELLIINLPHPGATNHNGGCIKFGNDGYLYISIGDGGGGGDPNGNGQNKNTTLGKLLRIDVNDFSSTYTIPSSNPFFSQTNVRKEIWAYGLRNAWRFSFDRETHDIWIADVGQNSSEEVNFQASTSAGGENYGWRCYEGNSSFNTSGCVGASNYKFPFFTYGHNSTSGGYSITGGFVYKGNKYADFRGYYIFADFVTGNFWLTKKTDSVFTTVQQSTPKQASISSFGEDIRGELYATNLNNGFIYKIRELCSSFKLNLVNKKNPSCPNISNGSIQLTSTGNNGTVTYNWSNSGSGNLISNLAPDKYVVTATDGIGCIRKDSFTLVNQDTLRVGILSQQNPSCPNVSNGQISVQALDGFGPITYNWNNGGSGATIATLAPGKFVVTASDSVGCTARDSIILFNADTLDNPTITQSSDTLYTATGFSYQWKKNDTNILGANQVFYKFLTEGNYKVEITDINGCKATSDNFAVIRVSVKNKISDIQQFTIFPNPATNNLTLDIRFNITQKSTLKIINSIGQMVYTESLQGKEFLKTISLQQFSKGIYQLEIITDDGQISNQAFVKE